MRKKSFKFTATSVARLKAPDPSGKTATYWDSTQAGFIIQVSGTTGFMKYGVQKDMPNGGPSKRVMLCNVAGTDVEDARRMAEKVIGEIAAGKDPKHKLTDRETATVREILDDYLASRDLRPATATEYRADVERYLGDWLDLEMRTITYTMVEERHAQIQRDVEQKWAKRRRERINSIVQAFLSEVSKATIDRMARPTVTELSSKLHHAITDGKDEPEIRSRMASLAHACAKVIAPEKLTALATLPPEPEGKRNGRATANGVLTILGVLWNFQAWRLKGEFPSSPVKLLTNRHSGRWFVIPAREKIIKVEDLPRFYRAVMELSNPVQRDYVLTLLFSGLRATNCATIAWDPDVDLVERSIRISGRRTKNRKLLPLPMTDILYAIFVARRSVGREKYVFPSDSRSGRIADPGYPLELVARKTGLYFGPHDVRRTWRTIAGGCSVSLNAIEALMNHSLDKQNDVSARYDSLSVEELREPAQKIADKIKALCQVPAVAIAGENVTALTR